MLSTIIGHEAGWEYHKFTLTHADLTEETADTDMTIAAATVAAGDIWEVIGVDNETPFEDASDGAFNSVALSAGDGDDVDHYLTASQLNVNGTEITYKAGTGTRRCYTAADTLDFLVESMTAKSLSNIDTGKAHIYARRMKLAALR